MQLSTFTKKLTDIERSLFEDYLKDKVLHFEKFLTEFDHDTVKLQIMIEKFVNKEAYKVEMIMKLPKIGHQPLCASEDSHDIRKAIDFAEAKLMEQLKKAMQKLHQEHHRPT